MIFGGYSNNKAKNLNDVHLLSVQQQQGIEYKLEENGKLQKEARFYCTAQPILVQGKVFVFDYSESNLHICKQNAWKMKTKAEWMKA